MLPQSTRVGRHARCPSASPARDVRAAQNGLRTLVVGALATAVTGLAAAQGITLFPGPPVTIGSAQTRVAIVDLNLDGIPDLVIAASSIVAYIGQGDGRFGAGIVVAAASARDFVVADFNRDGSPDLLIEDGRVFLGNGNGSFHAGPALPGGFKFRAAADFDGDGCVDAVLMEDGNSFVLQPARIHLFRGNCDGTFRPEVVTDTTVHDFSSGVAAGDFDGDGRADLAIAFTNAVMVYPGQADAHFGAARATGIVLPGFADIGLGGGRVLAGDVDRDGKLDLVAASLVEGSFAIALGNGDGTFHAAPAPTPTGITRGLAMADLDGNGRSDFALVGCLAFACNPDNRLYVFPGVAGAYGAATTFATGFKPTDVAIGDLDGDGRPDIVVTTEGNEALLFLSAPLAASPSVVPAVGPASLALLLLALLASGAYVLHRKAPLR